MRKVIRPILVLPSWQTEDAQVHVQTVYVRNESLLSFASSDLPFLQSFYLCVSHRYWYDECTAAKSTDVRPKKMSQSIQWRQIACMDICDCEDLLAECG